MPKPKNKYDQKHLRNLEYYQKQIDEIYKQAVQEAVAIGQSIDNVDTSVTFTFDDYPLTKRRVAQMLNDLNSSVQVCIVNGINSEWTLANNKNNALADMVFGKNKGKLSQAEYRRYYSTNESARDAFLARKVNGLSLSDRVWKYTDMFKDEIEMGLDLGIRGGLPATEMARDLKQYLQHPDMLFRRVRDEYGNLHLSQRAKAFHPGRGVYRSSYMNARRTTATECNMAYRSSDYERWQQQDFVVGIEIHLSNNHTCKGRDGKPHPFEDICDELQGKYPKDFKFTGWHPHCRCYATSILKTDEEMKRDTEKILRGEKPDNESVNKVKDVPQAYKDWIKNNQERIANAKSIPYFLKDNPQYSGVVEVTNVNTVTNVGAVSNMSTETTAQNKPTPLEIAQQRHANRTSQQTEEIQQRWYRRKLDRLNDAIQDGRLPVSSQDALNKISDSILHGNYDDAQRRISVLEVAMQRHQTRTPQQINDILIEVQKRKQPPLVTKGNKITICKASKDIMSLGTYKEIEDYCMKNGIVTDIDLKSVPIEIAKEICSTWAQYKNDWNLPPISLSTKRMGSHTFAQANGGRMEINPSYFNKKNASTALPTSYNNCAGEWLANKRQQINTLKKNGIRLQKEIDEAKRNGDVMKEKSLRVRKSMLDKTLADIEKTMNEGHTRHNVFLNEKDMPRNTVQHEFGHTIDDRLLGRINGSYFKLPGRLTAAEQAQAMIDIENLYNKYKNNCGWLSIYGTTNSKEFMAESMVLYMDKGGVGMPQDVKDWFDNLKTMANRKHTA